MCLPPLRAYLVTGRRVGVLYAPMGPPFLSAARGTIWCALTFADGALVSHVFSSTPALVPHSRFCFRPLEHSWRLTRGHLLPIPEPAQAGPARAFSRTGPCSRARAP